MAGACNGASHFDEEADMRFKEWLTANPAAQAAVRRIALVLFGVLLAESAEWLGVSPEQRAAIRDRLCSELFLSSPIQGLPSPPVVP